MKRHDKRYSKHDSLGMIVLLLALAGCSSNDADNGGTTNGTRSISTTFATQAANSEALPIDSASQLKNDINTLFSHANEAPIELQQEETLRAIFERVGS